MKASCWLLGYIISLPGMCGILSAEICYDAQNSENTLGWTKIYLGDAIGILDGVILVNPLGETRICVQNCQKSC